MILCFPSPEISKPLNNKYMIFFLSQYLLILGGWYYFILGAGPFYKLFLTYLKHIEVLFSRGGKFSDITDKQSNIWLSLWSGFWSKFSIHNIRKYADLKKFPGNHVFRNLMNKISSQLSEFISLDFLNHEAAVMKDRRLD